MSTESRSFVAVGKASDHLTVDQIGVGFDSKSGNSKEIQAIFILGARHSGTTILYKMLAMHPALAWFSQYSQRNGTIPHRLALPGHGWINRRASPFLKHDWHKAKSGRIDFIPRPGEGTKIWDYILPPQGGVPESVSIRRMRLIFTAECSAWRKAALILKLPRLTRRIQILHKAYPEARFIHIVRDGRAVAISNRGKFRQPGEPSARGLQRAADHWCETLAAVQQQKGKIRLFEIRYEDFCLGTHTWLKRLISFCSLDFSDFNLQLCPRFLTPTNEIRLRSVSPAELAFLEERMGGMLGEYRYADRHDN